MIKWEKPNGTTIETNDSPETVAYCESLGWKRAGAKKPAAKKSQPETDTEAE